jgi:hypothetical protein
VKELLSSGTTLLVIDSQFHRQSASVVHSNLKRASTRLGSILTRNSRWSYCDGICCVYRSPEVEASEFRASKSTDHSGLAHRGKVISTPPDVRAHIKK